MDGNCEFQRGEQFLDDRYLNFDIIYEVKVDCTKSDLNKERPRYPKANGGRKKKERDEPTIQNKKLLNKGTKTLCVYSYRNTLS